MKTCDGYQVVWDALLCNSSDIQATRKVGRFVGHAALKVCSRCLKYFPTNCLETKLTTVVFPQLNGQSKNMMNTEARILIGSMPRH